MTETLRLPVAEGVELAANLWPGEGPSFLLLHGLASNRRLWRGVAEEIAAAGHAVAAIDLRGHGDSDRPPVGYDFATMSADVMAAARVLGFERPAIAGQSYGGNLALEVADRHGAGIRGIAAVDGGVLDLGSRFLAWEDCEAVLSPPELGMPLDDVRSHFVEEMATWPDGSVEAVMACYETVPDGDGVRARLPREHHLTILRSMWEHRPTELLRRVTVPVLLVPCDTGDSEWTAHKRDTIAVAERDPAGLRVRWLEAHHDVHLQQPQAVAEALLGAQREGFFV